MTSRTSIDRAALVRRAVVELVAERGIHGTSMSQVAERAGVATGTAYVHYESKEDLLIAAFVDAKQRLGRAGIEGIGLDEEPRAVFEAVWRQIHRHLEENPGVARFLVQLEASPLRRRAHEALPGNDPLTRIAEGMAVEFIDLPPQILYDLALAPAVRLVAGDIGIGPEHLATMISSCWRAVTLEG